MGYLPQQSETDVSRKMIDVFGGYDHAPRIQDNEFYKMQNLSSDLYPLLSTRKRRGRVRQLLKPNGLFAHDKLCWVDGTQVYYDGQVIGTVTDSEKQIVGMGAYILIWPDKVSYNTKTGEYKQLGNKVQTSGEVSVTLCRMDGTPYDNYTAADTAPKEPEDGQYWLDTSVTPNVLKQYSSTYSMWTSIATTYIKIDAAGIGSGFAEYDGVEISGLTDETLNGSFVLYKATDDSIVVTAIISAAFKQTAVVTVERKIPDMDYIAEHENRLWGCSSANHEVYCCVLGDPTNWNRFLGVATDSYAATVGTPGAFTGCITHQGYVLFFKDNVIHKVYGNKPANFQIASTNCRGVQRGSERSLVVVNETLFYKSVKDVCVYGGALPESISPALGQVRYKGAVAGADGSKYYISMQREDTGTWEMLTYDGDRGLWHKEDGMHAKYFAAYDSDLYFISADDNCLYSVHGSLDHYADSDAAREAPLEFMAQTGEIGLESPDGKYVQKFQLRLDTDDGTLLRVEVQFDTEDVWHELERINGTARRSFLLPVPAQRCDTMRLRIIGKGGFRLYSLAKSTEYGGDAP